jgi:2-methylisocitrate lyase-like PEP mutase family enzyme
LKAITRTVRSFERMGVAGIAFEDLNFPPMLDRPPGVIARIDMLRKLEAALAARRDSGLFIIGRTDAAHTVGLEEALARSKDYQSVGVDAVLATGLQDLDAYRRLRDAVTVPIFAVVVPGSPWFALTAAHMTEIGIDAALYPAAVLSRILIAIREGLESIRSINGAGRAGQDLGNLAGVLRTGDWVAIDKRFAS